MIAAELDRYRGAMVGLALGDSLGASYEFKGPGFFVSHSFGAGVFGTAPGAPTDDSILARALAESLLEVNWPGAYVARLLAFIDSDPPDVGIQTRFAAESWRRGLPPPPDEEAQGNGSLMAAAPIALRYSRTLLRAEAEARSLAYLTHPSSTAAETNAIFVRLLAAELRHGTGRPFPYRADLEMPSRSVDVAGPKQGWCVLALSLAVAAVEAARMVGPYEALRATIALGGDTDTNGAIAGALLGARYGVSAWPSRLQDGLVLAEPMAALADDLFEAEQTEVAG